MSRPFAVGAAVAAAAAAVSLADAAVAAGTAVPDAAATDAALARVPARDARRPLGAAHRVGARGRH